jgi:hypothetical protein
MFSGRDGLGPAHHLYLLGAVSEEVDVVVDDYRDDMLAS